MDKAEVKTVPDVAAAGACLFEKTAQTAVASRGRFLANLSGGFTPLRMYELLAKRSDLPWVATWVTWGDERYVPHDDPQSNYGAAREALLDKVAIPSNQILTWPWGTDLHPTDAAAAYARLLRNRIGDPPKFDLTFLGLGTDAHTASLFPSTGAVLAKGLTVAVDTPEHGWRVSMTARALSGSRVVVFLVAGEEKRKALEATLAEKGKADRFPARAIAGLEGTVVITDLEI